MDTATFETALGSWHDFYLAAGSASAALLGLLFVGVSINLSAITAAERLDLQTRANLAFSNLLYLLGLSLIALMPGSDAIGLAISLAIVAILGLARMARRIVGLVRSKDEGWRSADTIRRLAWTVVADVLLLFIAWSLASSGDAGWLRAMPIVVLVLLLGAADISWDLLVREGNEIQARG